MEVRGTEFTDLGIYYSLPSCTHGPCFGLKREVAGCASSSKILGNPSQKFGCWVVRQALVATGHHHHSLTTPSALRSSHSWSSARHWRALCDEVGEDHRRFDSGVSVAPQMAFKRAPSQLEVPLCNIGMVGSLSAVNGGSTMVISSKTAMSPANLTQTRSETAGLVGILPSPHRRCRTMPVPPACPTPN